MNTRSSVTITKYSGLAGWFFILLILAVFIFPGCEEDQDQSGNPVRVESQVDGDYLLDDETEINISNVVGSLVLTGESATNIIRWQLNKKVDADSYDSAVAGLDNIELTCDRVGDTLSLQIEHPAQTGELVHACDLALGIPYKMSVRVVVVGGEVNISNLDTIVIVQSAAGNLVLASHLGSCAIAGVTGSLTLEVALPTGGFCRAATVDGNISLSIPSQTTATVHLQTTGGTATHTNLDFENLTLLTNQLDGILGTGNGEISLTSTNGNLSISGI
ncbi:MAG: hypothetical protein ABIA75_01350 [Candidatus Neomarinimicrobiota bacterium]